MCRCEKEIIFQICQFGCDFAFLVKNAWSLCFFIQNSSCCGYWGRWIQGPTWDGGGHGAVAQICVSSQGIEGFFAISAIRPWDLIGVLTNSKTNEIRWSRFQRKIVPSLFIRKILFPAHVTEDLIFTKSTVNAWNSRMCCECLQRWAKLGREKVQHLKVFSIHKTLCPHTSTLVNTRQTNLRDLDVKLLDAAAERHCVENSEIS